MEITVFYFRAMIALLSLVVSFYACQAIRFDTWIKKDHVFSARILYALIVIGFAYVLTQFVLLFLYRI